jgi:neutral ceramidase
LKSPGRLCVALCLGALFAAPRPAASLQTAAAAATSNLLAGTGKALIDPPPAQLPIRNNNDSPLVAIHDSLYARALVLQGKDSKAVIVVADVIMMSDEFYEQAVARIAAACSVARDHVWLSATHVHTVPWSMGNGYGEVVLAGLMNAVETAQQHLEPVRIAAGNGQAYINMNRDEASAGGFILGQDPEGPSDKTVRVVGFFRADGSPLAILANYAVHAVTLYSSDTAGDHAAMVSADIPGIADRFVDEHYGAQRTLTFWTSGAAGDQNPIMMSYHAEPGSDGKVQPSDLQAAGFMLTKRLGQALALQIIRVTDRLVPREAPTTLRAAQAVISCPAKLDPQTKHTVRISYLGIGAVDLVGISGEVTTLIDWHLRKRLGARSPLLLTLTNGYSGYLPDEASYARGNTFEVGKTQFAPGCVEAAIIGQTRQLLGPALR